MERCACRQPRGAPVASRAMGEYGRLTDEPFWDTFWASVEVPAEVDRTSIFDRSFLPILARGIAASGARKVVEVGCAPGRWLSYCARQHGLAVTGYESSSTGARKTRENFAAQGIEGNVVEEDFLTADLPREAFDLVLSLGFIEHFDDPTDVVARHAQLLRPGGVLVLEVPNLRGITLALLRWSRSTLLAHHNMAVMAPRELDRLAGASGLHRLEVGYFGGFEPSYVDLSAKSLPFRAAFSAVGRVRRMAPVLDRVNTGATSGYLCGLYRKPRSR